MIPKLFIYSLLIVLFVSCNDTNTNSMMKTNSVNTDLKLEGTWELIGHYNFKDNVVVDSFKASPHFKQYKIYTDTKVMWCKYFPADSSEWFGYGSYNYKNDTLNEVLDFGSAVMNKVIEENKNFTFELTLEKNWFEQIELDGDGNRIYSENYKRIE